jgi:hypothetical protein
MNDASKKDQASQRSTSNEPIKFNLRPDEPDYVLQALVDLINSSEISFGISLTVGGFLISGNLISGKKYFDGVASEMASAYKDHAGASDAMKTYFSNFGKIYDNYSDEKSRNLPVFIHLSEAKFFHNAGAPFPGNRGVFWRGRVSCVSSFILGKLSAS